MPRVRGGGGGGVSLFPRRKSKAKGVYVSVQRMKATVVPPNGCNELNTTPVVEDGVIEYLREKEIPLIVEGMVKYLGHHRPSDPFEGIRKWVSTASDSRCTSITDSILEKCQFGPLLGKGSFAKVYLGLLPTGQYIAVKQVALADNDEADFLEEIEKAQQEIRLMKTVQHSNIVQCFGSSFEEGHASKERVFKIYMEYVGGRTLAQLTRGFQGLAAPVVRDYTRQIVTGLHVLHKAGICHRDIKPENILVDLQSGLLKLCDFGCSKQIDKIKTGKGKACQTVAGSPYYMSPEILNDDDGYDGMSADIWSLGATVIQMATGNLPWPKSSSDVAAILMISQAQSPPTEVPPASVAGEQCVNFISCCCALDPADRPSAEELLDHPYLWQKD